MEGNVSKNLKFEIDGIGISVEIPVIEKVVTIEKTIEKYSEPEEAYFNKEMYRHLEKGDTVEFETIYTKSYVRTIDSILSGKIVDGFYVRADYSFGHGKFFFMEDAERVTINFMDGSCIESRYIKSIKAINKTEVKND